MAKHTIFILLILAILGTGIPAYAEEDTEPVKVEMTCYCYTGNLAKNGQYPRKGTCAYLEQYIGDYLILVYEDAGENPGELIGYYEVYDTGYGRPTKQLKKDGTPYGTLELGISIDIYQESLVDCYQFIKDHGDTCYIQIIAAEG